MRQLRTIAVVALITLAGARASTAARAPIPPHTIRKIRAVHGTADTLIPAWMPHGFVFTSWRTHFVSPAYLTPTLIISFARNGSSLDWVVLDAHGSTPSCDAGTGIQTKILHYHGHKMVWSTGNRFGSLDMCMTVGKHSQATRRFDLSVQVGYGPGTPTLSQLERMLLSAHH